MKVKEYYLSEYYHQFITIEADVLTERFKDRVEVTEEDCYALCSGYVSDEGMTAFAVLSIGPSWETCTKGLEQEEMLGTMTIEETEDREARLVEADLDMVEKNDAFLEKAEQDTEPSLYDLRLNPVLDPLRDYWYPDVVPAEIPGLESVQEYAVELKGMKADFLYGTVEECPDGECALEEGDTVWMVPAVIEEETVLVIVYTGETMSEELMEKMYSLFDSGRTEENTQSGALPS